MERHAARLDGQAHLQRFSDTLITIRTADGRRIEATPEHPFFVAGRGFVAARKLARSDLLETEDGRTAAVVSLSERRGRFTVYNLEVEGTHTYFAGGWWVHNANYRLFRAVGADEMEKIKAAHGAIASKKANMGDDTRVFREVEMNRMTEFFKTNPHDYQYLVEFPLREMPPMIPEASHFETYRVAAAEINSRLYSDPIIRPL
jgi:hypothetical protein